jgi:hypothetical protein
MYLTCSDLRQCPPRSLTFSLAGRSDSAFLQKGGLTRSVLEVVYVSIENLWIVATY